MKWKWNHGLGYSITVYFLTLSNHRVITYAYISLENAGDFANMSFGSHISLLSIILFFGWQNNLRMVMGFPRVP